MLKPARAFRPTFATYDITPANAYARKDFPGVNNIARKVAH
jgi:hypothetical protein